MKIFNRLVSGLAALMLSSLAAASVVYTNGVPTTNSGLEVTLYRSADNFSIAGGANITSAEIYFAGGGDISAWDGTLEYFILASTAGAPGAVLASGNGTGLTVTDTGSDWCCGGHAYSLKFNLAAPFAAGAGIEYFLAIHAATDYSTRDNIYWVSGSAGDTVGAFAQQNGTGTWDDYAFELAFNLSADSASVPVPASLALVCLGLVGGAAARYRVSARR